MRVRNLPKIKQTMTTRDKKHCGVEVPELDDNVRGAEVPSGSGMGLTWESGQVSQLSKSFSSSIIGTENIRCLSCLSVLQGLIRNDLASTKTAKTQQKCRTQQPSLNAGSQWPKSASLLWPDGTNLTPSLRKLSSSVCTETSITLGKLRGGPLSWKWCLVLTWRANHGCWLEAHNKLESLNDCPKPMQASADRQRWNTPVRGFVFAPCLHDALALWIYLI